MEFFSSIPEDFNLIVNVSIVIFIVSFMYRFTNVEDQSIGVKTLTSLDEIFVLGNRKCYGSYVTEPRDAIPNKISGGTYEEIIAMTGEANNSPKQIIDEISPTGPYNVTAGATLRDRENKCELLRSFPGLENRVFVPVLPADEAFATLSSCTYEHDIGGAIFVGKSTFHIVPFISMSDDGEAISDFAYAFSATDHVTAAAAAATMVLTCMGKNKRILIAGSPTIPKYNEVWITDGSVEKQFITVTPLELACNIEQLGERGMDAITIIQKMVDLLFV